MLFLSKHMLPLLQKVFNINIPSIRKPANSIALWAPLFSRNFSGLLLFLAHIQKNTANDALGTTPLPVVFSFALFLLFSCKEFVACGTLAREPYYEILHCSSCPVRSPRIGKKIICCFFCFVSYTSWTTDQAFMVFCATCTYASGEYSHMEEAGVSFGFSPLLRQQKTILFVRAVKNGEANCCC